MNVTLRGLETAAVRKAAADSAPAKAAVSVLAGRGVASGGWLLASAGLWLAGSRWRRAGVDGLAAWAVAEVAAQGLKAATSRGRPLAVTRGSSPSSSSMPSAHTAAAVAYVTAAAVAAPALAVPGGLFAGSVAWSRLAAGRHFPSDVLVAAGLGAAAGVGVALLGRRFRDVTDVEVAG